MMGEKWTVTWESAGMIIPVHYINFYIKAKEFYKFTAITDYQIIFLFYRSQQHLPHANTRTAQGLPQAVLQRMINFSLHVLDESFIETTLSVLTRH